MSTIETLAMVLFLLGFAIFYGFVFYLTVSKTKHD